jgi:hypothetical protein
MTGFHFGLRAAASWLLVSVLSGVFPAAGADGPSTTLPDRVHSSGLESAAPQPGALLLTRAFQDPAPQPVAQEPSPQSVAQRPPADTPATATPAKRHIPRWVWIAVIAGVAVGAGAAIVIAGHQPGKTSPPVTSVTINVGSGSAGAP